MLLTIHAAASICMWMNDVTAAWVMTSITSSPRMVALVQSATTLPIFLLGLPGGALADMFDRRCFLLVSQLWAATVALLYCITLALHEMSPALLLLLTFANGVGMAMRWPVLSALVPETVPRMMLQGALSLNSVAFNTSRIVGPLIAGAVIASLGSVYVFALNAALSSLAVWMILRWKRQPDPPRGMARNQLGAAIRAGVLHVGRSARLRGILLRVVLFFTYTMALIALLPLVARQLHGAGATTFTLMLMAMGCGAVVSTAFVLPRARQSMSADILLGGGSLLMSASMLAVAVAPNVMLALLAMLVAGVAWTTVANSLSVLMQLALPDAVRARGMSIHMVCMMGSSALGAAFWGQIAALTGVAVALGLSAASSVLCLWAMRKQRLGHAFGTEVPAPDPDGP